MPISSSSRAALEQQMTIFDLASAHFHLFLQIDPGTLIVLTQTVFPMLRRGKPLARWGKGQAAAHPLHI